MKKILIRATNWLGDAVMSLPALRVVRERFPSAEISVLARPWVADLYARESFVDRVIPYTPAGGFHYLAAKRRAAASLRAECFDCAILFQNAFEAAAIVWLADIPRRVGYARDGRGWLLTDPVPVPRHGEIPRHERFYYLELLRRAGLGPELPANPPVRLANPCTDRELRIGISPGAAYGTAKRWLPERFAETAVNVAREHGAAVALFGSASERALCEQVGAVVRASGVAVHNYAGETSLREFMDLAARCRIFLTNDSGAMHTASALGVPTLAVFGATDDVTTGPTGGFARVLRRHVECSPCLLRECPIDHRCMTAVTVDSATAAALLLWKESEREAPWTPEAKS